MNETLKAAIVSGVVRHASQAFGGVLVGTGIGTGNDAEVVVGLGINAAAFGWSAFRKWRRNRKAKKGD